MANTKTQKKRGRPSKKEIESKAKQKVEELTGSLTLSLPSDSITITNNAKTTNKTIKSVASNKGKEWLEEQVNALANENERLRSELANAKQDYQKLRNSSETTPNDDVLQIQANVRSLFNELNNNYLGKNNTKTPYRDVKIKAILEKMLQRFSFLLKK